MSEQGDKQNERGLTEKQERFCIAYVANHGNATSAAKEAGYSPESASFIGYENLRKPYVLERIAEIRKETGVISIVSVEWILSKLRENAERALQAEPVLNSEGKPTGEFKYDGSTANRALELLGKSMGAFVDRVQSDNTNLNVNTDAGKLTPERSNRIVAILDRARARRDNADSGKSEAGA